MHKTCVKKYKAYWNYNILVKLKVNLLLTNPPCTFSVGGLSLFCVRYLVLVKRSDFRLFLAGVAGYCIANATQDYARQSKSIKGDRTFGSHLHPQHKKNNPTQKVELLFFGRGSWVRTNEVTESESVALPLGDTPMWFAHLF